MSEYVAFEIVLGSFDVGLGSFDVALGSFDIVSGSIDLKRRPHRSFQASLGSLLTVSIPLSFWKSTRFRHRRLEPPPALWKGNLGAGPHALYAMGLCISSTATNASTRYVGTLLHDSRARHPRCSPLDGAILLQIRAVVRIMRPGLFLTDGRRVRTP